MSLRASKSGRRYGIDLGDDVAGQEAEPLAGLDGRAHQHDLLDLRLAQHADRHADGQIGLAGAGRADAEGQVVLAHGADVAAPGRRCAAGGSGRRSRRQCAAGRGARRSPPCCTTSRTVRTSSGVSLPCWRSIWRSCSKTRSAWSTWSSLPSIWTVSPRAMKRTPRRVADRSQVLVAAAEEQHGFVAAVEGDRRFTHDSVAR